MTQEFNPTPVDTMEIEARARRMRAEAFANGLRTFANWVRRSAHGAIAYTGPRADSAHRA